MKQTVFFNGQIEPMKHRTSTSIFESNKGKNNRLKYRSINQSSNFNDQSRMKSINQ